MNSNKPTSTVSQNLLHNKQFCFYLKIQIQYGVAHRGGTQYPSNNHQHLKRLVCDVNLLSSNELKIFALSEIILNN